MGDRPTRRAFVLASAVAVGWASPAWGQMPEAQVLVRGYNGAQTGENVVEPYLKPVNVSGLTQIATIPLTVTTTYAQVYAQILYVSNLAVSANGATVARNAVVIADTKNIVSVYDADTFQPIWTHAFGGPPISCSKLPGSNFFGQGSCNNYTAEVGIVGTPAILPAPNQLGPGPLQYTMYFVTRTAPTNAPWLYDVWAVDVGTGNTSAHNQIVGVAGANNATLGVPTTGGWLAFEPGRENQRESLLANNGQLYIGFGSYGDAAPYQGWLVAYPLPSYGAPLGASPSGVFAVTRTAGGEGGLWQAGRGPATDSYGNIYVATGNGAFDGQQNFGSSVLEFGPAMPSASQGAFTWMPAASFTPSNWQNLNKNDQDVGANGPLFVSDSSGGHILQVGKDGTFYNLAAPTGPGQPMGQGTQQVQIAGDPNATYDGANNSWPAFNDGAFAQGTFYSWTSHDVLRGYGFSNGVLTTANPALGAASLTSPEQEPATGIAISDSCGITLAGCDYSMLVWGTINGGPQSNPNSLDVPGGLVAYGRQLGAPLWQSPVGQWALAKWNPPTVAGGKVFVPTFSGEVVVYGLAPTPASFVDPSGNLHVVSLGRGHSVIDYESVTSGALPDQVTGPGMANYSAQMVVRPSWGEVDVVNYNPAGSIDYHHFNQGAWAATPLTWPGEVIEEGSPGLFVDSTGMAHVVGIGYSNPTLSLLYASANPGSDFATKELANGNMFSSDPSIFVRSANPAQEVDIAVCGAGNALDYYFGTPQNYGPLNLTVIPGATCASRPGIFVESSGMAHVVSQGTNDTLWHCGALPSAPWTCTQIGAAGSTYSAPQVVVRTANPAGEVDVVAEGANQSVLYYHFTGQPTANMAADSIAGNNVTVSAPSIAVDNARGLVSVTVQAPNTGTPVVYQATPGQPLPFAVTNLAQ